MTVLIILANILGWPVIHIVLALAFLHYPDECFARDSWLTLERRFERDGRFYRSVLAVQRWKGLLPDAAPWMGGRSKRRLGVRNPKNLVSSLIETRRAETAHWCMLLCTPVFYIWNPVWACVVMTAYGIAANLPCIIAQRANRIKLAHILHRSAVRWLRTSQSG